MRSLKKIRLNNFRIMCTRPTSSANFLAAGPILRTGAAYVGFGRAPCCCPTVIISISTPNLVHIHCVGISIVMSDLDFIIAMLQYRLSGPWPRCAMPVIVGSRTSPGVRTAFRAPKSGPWFVSTAWAFCMRGGSAPRNLLVANTSLPTDTSVVSDF